MKNIPRKRSSRFKTPECYKNNPKLLEARAKKEDSKKKKEEAEFFEWYNKELKKYGYR